MASFQTILGTDGIAPYYNPTDKWAIWSISDVFTGKEGKDKYVPKVNDYVIDPVSFTVYIVVSIDFNTYTVTMNQIAIASPSSTMSNVDKILSPTTTDTSNTYRVYYDNSVSPASVSVDARLLIYSNRATYAKLFKGASVTDPNSSISIYYDNSGSPVSDSIPLGSVAYDNTNNYYNKTVPTFFTNDTLINGDQVTLVIYDANGSVVSTQVLVSMVVTGYVQATGPKKYITGISLDSSYNSDTDANTILVPSNLSIHQLALKGVVNYSDGSSKYLDIKPGSGFFIYGLDQFDNKQYDVPMTVVLKYIMQDGEGAIGNLTYDNKCVTGSFNLVSTVSYVSSTFGLYGYPVWVDSSQGYEVIWYLMSGSRNVFYNITDKVKLSSNSSVSGNTFNIKQLAYASVYTGDVSDSLPAVYVNNQVGFTFNSPDNLNTSPFLVYEQNGTLPDRSYGLLLRVKALDNSYKTFDITFNTYDFDTWLNMTYYNSLPIINNQIETKAPLPTHFEILYNPTKPTTDISKWADQLLSAGYEISEWNTPVYVPSALYSGSTIVIKFLLINGTSNSVLGACSVIIQ